MGILKPVARVRIPRDLSHDFHGNWANRLQEA